MNIERTVAHQQTEAPPETYLSGAVMPILDNLLGKSRAADTNIIEVDKILNYVLADTQSQNPGADTTTLYRLFAQKLPYFISSRHQQEAVQAIVNRDPNIARAGTRVLVLMNMKTIIVAAQPYLTGDPNIDSDLIQAGIVNLLAGITRIKTGQEATPITVHMHNLVEYGVAQEIASRDKVHVSWVIRDRLDRKITAIVKASLACHPLGLSEEAIEDLASQISAQIGIPPRSVKVFVRYRNSLTAGEDQMRDEQDLINELIKPSLAQRLEELLTKISPHQATVIKARFGFLDRKYTYDEAGRLINITREGASQAEDAGLRALRKPPYALTLRPFIHPDAGYHPHTSPKETPPPPRPVETRITHSALLGVQVDAMRMKYKYPIMNLILLRLFRPTSLELSPSIFEALAAGKIYTIAQLLGQTDQNLLAIKGIYEEQLRTIKSALIKFLAADAKAMTLGDKLFGRI